MGIYRIFKSIGMALSLSAATVVLASDANIIKSKPIDAYEQPHLAKLIASEIIPDSEPVVDAVEGGRTSFRLTGEIVPGSPRLYFNGNAVGQFSNRNTIMGQSSEYHVPQLLVGLSFVDPTEEILECGYAILEPTAEEQKLRFGGLRRVHLGSGDPYAYLCGVIKGFQDKYGGIEKDTGDGIHELVTELHVVDRRLDAEHPPVFRELFAIDVYGPEPRLIGKLDSEQMEIRPENLSLYVEYSGVDEIKIVSNYHPNEKKEIELPSDLAPVIGGIPNINITGVVMQGNHITLGGTIADYNYIKRLGAGLEIKTGKPITWIYNREQTGGNFELTYISEAEK